jgi:hypothetical protein
MFTARRSSSMISTVPEMVMVWVGNVLVSAKLCRGRDKTDPDAPKISFARFIAHCFEFIRNVTKHHGKNASRPASPHLHKVE